MKKIAFLLFVTLTFGCSQSEQPIVNKEISIKKIYC